MEVQDSSNIIKKKFKLFSSNLAIIDENNNEITYNDLNNYSNLFSNLFNYKSLVFLLCENKLGSIISYFSLITNHQVPLLLSSPKGHHEEEEFVSVKNCMLIKNPSEVKSMILRM